MPVFIKIIKIMSKGGLAGKDMHLVCKGTLLEDSSILLKPKFHFHDALIGNTPLDPHHATALLLSPLHVETIIIANIKAGSQIWRAAISIDLNRWVFSVNPYLNGEFPFPPRTAFMLLSSFGLKSGRRELSFAALAAMKDSYKAYIKNSSIYRQRDAGKGPETMNGQ